jgi:hypothetical protein
VDNSRSLGDVDLLLSLLDAGDFHDDFVDAHTTLHTESASSAAESPKLSLFGAAPNLRATFLAELEQGYLLLSRRTNPLSCHLPDCFR